MILSDRAECDLGQILNGYEALVIKLMASALPVPFLNGVVRCVPPAVTSITHGLTKQLAIQQRRSSHIAAAVCTNQRHVTPIILPLRLEVCACVELQL